MRKVKMKDIEKNIELNKKEVNEQLQLNRGSAAILRRDRYRAPEEQKALTEIAKATIQRSKRDGKFKVIGDRRIYYDPAE